MGEQEPGPCPAGQCSWFGQIDGKPFRICNGVGASNAHARLRQQHRISNSETKTCCGPEHYQQTTLLSESIAAGWQVYS